SFTRNGNSPEVLDTNDYYPFGMNFLNSDLVSYLAQPWSKYKYNGKELQETGMYDYGARMYMPDIGRFAQIDPRSQYTHETYSYVWNNPIFFNDPTGMEGETGKCPPDCPSGISEINILQSGQRETTIQEINLIGKKAANNSFSPRGLAMAALMVSQADSPVPGPADVIAGLMLVGAGAWWTYNQFTQPSYTTIADSGVSHRNLKTEDTTEDDSDVNGITVPDEHKIPRDSLNPPSKPGNAPTFKKRRQVCRNSSRRTKRRRSL
ncbi:MAG: RHS repeat-associated core domain-containing protein, partial [Chryseobacterium sp.]